MGIASYPLFNLKYIFNSVIDGTARIVRDFSNVIDIIR